jgi:FkbM family methyltransferase
MTKWDFAKQHAGDSIRGFFRLLKKSPTFALRLFSARLRYFLTRGFGGPIATPDDFLIETSNELISYWSFFVEEECRDLEWIRPLRQLTQPLVLDVGANAGLFSHLVWQTRKDVRLKIFEPLPRMAGKIRKWQERTGAEAEIINKAVSDKPGIAELHTSAENDTTATLVGAKSGSTPLRVETVNLDSVFPTENVFLIKIDVEGHEPAVIRGAQNLLQRTRFLIVEAHTPEALKAIQAVLPGEWKTRQIGASDHLLTNQLVSHGI